MCFAYNGVEYSILNETCVVSGVVKNTSKLTDITIANSVNGIPVSVIQSGAFSDCQSVKSIRLGKNIKRIDVQAFLNCFSLENVFLSFGIETIQHSAFACCHSLKNIVIPNSVTCIGNYAFYDCTALESITIPDSVISVGLNAFNRCPSLKKINGQFNKFPPKVEFINLLEQLNKEYCDKN